MACLELESSEDLSTHQSFDDSFNLSVEQSISDEGLDAYEASTSSPYHISNMPEPPPVPGTSNAGTKFFRKPDSYCCVPKETLQTWDRLFEEGYMADVHIFTNEGDMVPAHSCVLGIASPALRNLLEQATVKDGMRCIKIPGVHSKAVYAFIRFLYSSCYEIDEMKKFALHLLVLAHVFCVPSLKKVCIDHLQQALLTTENVVDVLQLARQCDAPRLSLFCLRLVIKEFKTISASEGWKVMRIANPGLEQEILECLVEADTREQDKLKKMEEKKVYLQLHEAMEALLHICKDGCRTIGPCDKMLKGNNVTCSFSACKGLESLVRHFSGCKIRVPGGCNHCKRMWQLLELHSRMCSEPDYCNVPLCRRFKDKLPHQSKKEEQKWKLLVRKVIAVKGTISSGIAQRSPVI